MSHESSRLSLKKQAREINKRERGAVVIKHVRVYSASESPAAAVRATGATLFSPFSKTLWIRRRDAAAALYFRVLRARGVIARVRERENSAARGYGPLVKTEISRVRA